MLENLRLGELLKANGFDPDRLTPRPEPLYGSMPVGNNPHALLGIEAWSGRISCPCSVWRAADMASRDRRTSARIFELLARTTWLAFLLGCLLAEVGVWGWRGALAWDVTVPDRTGGMIIALALAGAVLEALVPLAFVWRRRVPLGAQGGSLAGATGNFIAVCAWLAAVGFLLALALRATLGAPAMLQPIAYGIGASMALWLPVKLHAWSEPLAQTGITSLGRLERLCHSLTTALLWALYLPVAWPSMLAARLRRMLREPLYYQCPHCPFRSANPAISVQLQPEQVRTWPTIDAPFVVRPASVDSRLVPTWRGLERLVDDGHQRYVAFFGANACGGLCHGAFGRRILVLGEFGAELAAVQAAIHRVASERLTPDPPALERAAAFAHAAAEGRWGVVSANGARLRIEGGDPGSAGLRGVIDIEVVGDFHQRIDVSAYQAVIVLPSRAGDTSADPRTYLASRLAQLRTSPAAPGAPPGKPHGGLAWALLLRLFGPAETGDRTAGETSSHTIVFLPPDPGGAGADLEAFGVDIASDANELCAFLRKVLQ